jgi:PTS system nitrogen regulatory IIA component
VTISALLTPELVLPALAAEGKAQVLDELALQVGRVHPHVDRRRLAEALHERERQASTALENGVAIPHARLLGVKEPVVALARSPRGVAFDAADGKPTHLFLLLVVSAEHPGAHLKLLARGARLVSNAHCRARLLAAAGAEELLAVLHEHETSVPSGVRAA